MLRLNSGSFILFGIGPLTRCRVYLRQFGVYASFIIPMLRIGLTGGIACGKSAVGDLLVADGIPVCDADGIAHETIRRGADVYANVVEAFGSGILDGVGEIDRKILGSRVFGCADDLARLNRLIHPEVRRRLDEWFACEAGRAGVAVAMVPLLFEVAGDWGWDRVICVTAPRRRQFDWLARRGLSPDEAARRIASQMPMEQKMAMADHVICNCGSVEMLREQTRKVWHRIAG